MYDGSGNHLSGNNGMYIDCPHGIQVKGGESECLRTDSSVREGYVMSPWFFIVCIKNSYIIGENGDRKDIT